MIPSCYGLSDPFGFCDKPTIAQETIVKWQPGIEDQGFTGCLSGGVHVFREKRRETHRNVDGLRVPSCLLRPPGDGLSHLSEAFSRGEEEHEPVRDLAP